MARMRLAYSAVWSSPGMMHGWKWRSVRAVCSSSCTVSWTKGSPSVRRSEWVMTSLTTASARYSTSIRLSSLAPAAPAHDVTCWTDGTESPRSIRDTVDWLTPSTWAT